ncbi:MAG: hypothetical protein DRJ42_06050 [Deltaproteobacteria bacterium]|nr:MAG: hypothetical protein DRJ42_06050 [Deltaproteobacteria bacterium]
MTGRDRPFDPVAIFRALQEGAVDFVVIGGWSATLQGVGWPTHDVDIVVAPDDENLERLLMALRSLEVEYDTFHQPPIRPDLGRLQRTPGPQLFRTRHGRLDVLKEAGGATFASLTSDAIEVAQGEGTVLCASIPALLRMKKAAGRPKDAAAIAQLEALLTGSTDD